AKIAVGVVVERRKAQSPWIDFTWKPVTALAGLPDAAPWTPLSQDGEGTTFYAGAAEIELYRTETANYRDNLGSSAPMLWVGRRPLCWGGGCGRRRPAAGRIFPGAPPIPPRAKPGPKRAAISSMWCRCRRRCARRSMLSSPSTMSSGRSTSASATAPIRRRWRGADRCTKDGNERAGKLHRALVAG